MLTKTNFYGIIVLYYVHSTSLKFILKIGEDEPMKKTELKAKIEQVIDELMNYKLSEMLLQTVNETQADIDNNERADILREDFNLLNSWLQEFKHDTTAKKVDKADTKKALDKKATETAEKSAFKWLPLDGYKLLTAKNSAFETVDKSSIIAYRMDKTVIENLKKRNIEYSDAVDFSNAIFSNGIDYCKIIKKTAEYIDVESIRNAGATFRLWIEDFKKCIDGSNVAFRVCEKIIA